MKRRHNFDVLTTREAANLCGCGTSTIIRFIEAGEIKAWRVPGSQHRRMRRKDIYEFMRAHNIPIPEEETTDGETAAD